MPKATKKKKEKEADFKVDCCGVLLILESQVEARQGEEGSFKCYRHLVQGAM